MSKHKNKFSTEIFTNPPLENAPVYGWVWNAPLSGKKTDEQLDEMQRLGIKKFYIIPQPKLFRSTRIPTELEPDYLTDNFMREVRYTMEKARERQMHCWLYDEGGWPSGGAAGKVLKKHPEYARRTLDCIKTPFESGSVYKKSRKDILAAFKDADVEIYEGYKFEASCVVCEYFSHPHIFEVPGCADFPDITLEEATDCFIQITHEKYAEYISEFFGEHIGALFTDEPTAPRPFPFREGIIKEYEKVYNESPVKAFPALFGSVKPDEKTAEMRIKWYDLCSKLFCKNFMEKCREWSHSHGMKFTGHLDVDHMALGVLYGGSMHPLRSLRCFDIPGIDVIWRQIFPQSQKKVNIEDSANGFFPRYASSAAAQSGATDVMTESLGVYGNGITYEQMRFVFGFQAIRGVNIFNPMLISYGRSGYQLAGELPSFCEKYACFSDLAEWNRYLERLSYVFSVGKRICDTALYYPVRDMWAGINPEKIAVDFEKTGKMLEEKQIDFDIADDDVFENATGMEKGLICIKNARYKQIVVPSCEFMSEASKRNLKLFEENGGKVLNSADDLCRPNEITGESTGLQFMHRQAEKQEIYCIFNQNTEPKEFKFSFGGKKGYYIDITEGQIKPLIDEDGLIKISLCGGEIGAVCITEECPQFSEPICYKNSITVNHGFKFRRQTSLEIENNEAISCTIEESPVEATLGDWSKFAGVEFSGSAKYEVNLEIPESDSDSVLLDLGDVRHTCEVIINGKSLGKRLMSPYRYIIPKEILKQKNNLVVIVKNTAGNKFQHTNAFDKWAEWMLTEYFERTKEFDKDTLSSGLFGPVRILF